MERKEAHLIDSVKEGNLADFTPLVEKYQGVVYGLVLSIVRDFSAAQDIVQEAFITAHEKIGQLRDPDRFASWLKKIALNRAKLHVREQRKREAVLSDQPAIAVPSPERIGPEKDEFEAGVTAIVGSLSERLKVPVTLCYMEDLRYREVARFLGIRENTLRKRLHDAKIRLQRQIIEMAEKTLKEHRLPKNFAARCICGCEKSTRAKGKGVSNVALKKQPRKVKAKRKAGGKIPCTCGCLPRAGKSK